MPQADAAKPATDGNGPTGSLSIIRSLKPDQPAAGFETFIVIAADGSLIGVVTRRELLDPALDDRKRVRDLVTRRPAVVFEQNTLREAADHMVRERVGRLPVVTRQAPRRVVGIISRSDLLSAHQDRLDAAMVTETPPIARGWLRRQAKRNRTAS